MSRFEHRAIQELYRQLVLSPPEVRRRQADRLERLLLSLRPEQEYPYEFLYFRVTGFRPTEESRQVFRGKEVVADLHVALEALSGTAPEEATAQDQQVLTCQQVAERCEVTTRTVRRWRRRGLVARKYRFPDGRTRVGIRTGALERFEGLYGEKLDRSAGFSRMEPEEEQRILELVTEFRAEQDTSLTEATARAAEQVGRAQETVRLLVRRHSRRHPQDGRLSAGRGRLSRPARRAILEDYRRNVPVEQVADRYRRSRSSIYRIINQERARDLLDTQVDYIAEDDFAEPQAGQQIAGAEWRAVMRRLEAHRPQQQLGAPLEAREETVAFRCYNYTKWLLAEGHKRLNPRRYVSGRLVRHLEEMADRAGRIRLALLRAYRPLAERVARQHGGPDAERLEQEARSALARAIEQFDYRGRGRFPAYLRLDLQKRFARLPAEKGEPPA